MKTGRVLGSVLTTLALSGMALYAEPAGTREAGPGGPPPVRPAGPQNERMEGRPGPRGGPAMMMMEPEQARKAGASEQQVQALADAAFAQQTKRIDLQAAVEKADLALEHLMRAATVDEKAAMEAADAVSKARADLFKLDIASRLKVKQILGEELLRKMHEQAPRPDAMERPGRGPAPEGQNPPPAENARPAPEHAR